MDISVQVIPDLAFATAGKTADEFKFLLSSQRRRDLNAIIKPHKAHVLWCSSELTGSPSDFF